MFPQKQNKTKKELQYFSVVKLKYPYVFRTIILFITIFVVVLFQDLLRD